MSIEDFNDTIDIWINELERYDFAQLCVKPFPGGWSLGQVYMHLIENVDYNIEQIKLCISTNDNMTEQASPAAQAMFFKNDFPDEIMEGPPENNFTPQPDSKEQLLHDLMRSKAEMNDIEKLISTSLFKGKTKHPGLNFFNAAEWFQFAEMHLRHHLRQKKRIDDFLEMKRLSG